MHEWTDEDRAQLDSLIPEFTLYVFNQSNC